LNGYFDANATTALHPAARDAWLAAPWHNPSSLYREAAAAHEYLEDCRQRLADILDCDSGELIFVSGATEANNAVLDHFIRHGRPIAVSAIEHPSIREPAAGAWRIPTGSDGIVSLDAVRDRLRENRPALVSLMAANNETGVLQPWPDCLTLCRNAGVAYHCDAAQWLGKLPASGLGECDFLTGSAHKFGGPKGVGFLKVSAAHGPLRWLRGGPQEERQRAGTENLPGIAAMVAALETVECRLAERDKWELHRNEFEAAIRSTIPDIRIVAADSPRLWNSVLLVMPRHPNVKWLARLSREGFQVSTGSACSSGEGASEVLAAMGLAADALGRVIRVSSTWDQTSADWAALAGAFADIHTSLEKDGGR